MRGAMHTLNYCIMTERAREARRVGGKHLCLMVLLIVKPSVIAAMYSKRLDAEERPNLRIPPPPSDVRMGDGILYDDSDIRTPYSSSS